MPPGNRPLVAPIYQCVKFTFDDVAETERHSQGERDGFYYSRISNPTLAAARARARRTAGPRRVPAHRLGNRRRSRCRCWRCTKAGRPRRVLRRDVPADAQPHPPRAGSFRRHEHACCRSTTSTGSSECSAERPTRLIVFESPTNPVLKVADIERITALARRHGALTLLDNTLAGLHNHGDYDVDLFVHSLTKYVSGHGDVMGGAIIGRAELIEAHADGLDRARPDSRSARGLPDAARAEDLSSCAGTPSAAARSAVAEFLRAQPAVERVRYPGLADDPGS